MNNASQRLEVLEEAIYSKVLDVIRLLRESNRRIVLAESCTGGLAAAWFTSVPGASDVFCGSMVVYRNDTKSQWL
ncbi:MAG: CinA family protein, partial [Pirellula sp.]